MKKILILSVFVCLSAISAFAQEVVNTKDFSGDWELDASKSKLDERARIESMTMKVMQTNNDVKIETNIKRSTANSDGGGMMNREPQTLIYSLEKGKFTKIDTFGTGGSGTAILTADFDGDKLKLNQARTFNTQRGEISTTVKEIWTLSADGKTLTVKRETESPRGTNSSEMVFAKKEIVKMMSSGGGDRVSLMRDVDGKNNQIKGEPRTISGGVVNGKARNLVTPKYPEAARSVKASGAVVVAVTIDEEGNVISAEAISGHPLLRGAAVEAARASKFAPTLLDGAPVKVTGNIVYNFVP